MTTPLACDLTVFTQAQRERLRGLVRRVFDACLAAEELPDGYRLRFPADPDQADAAPFSITIAEWITLERLCCPCIRFAIEFEDERGPIAVRMTGRPGIKPFLLAEFKGRLAEKLPQTR